MSKFPRDLQFFFSKIYSLGIQPSFPCFYFFDVRATPAKRVKVREHFVILLMRRESTLQRKELQPPDPLNRKEKTTTHTHHSPTHSPSPPAPHSRHRPVGRAPTKTAVALALPRRRCGTGRTKNQLTEKKQSEIHAIQTKCKSGALRRDGVENAASAGTSRGCSAALLRLAKLEKVRACREVGHVRADHDRICRSDLFLLAHSSFFPKAVLHGLESLLIQADVAEVISLRV